MSNFGKNSEQNLFQGIKSILENADLKTFEKMIMIVMKMYHVEHEQVFPDYDTIAAAGGMSKRKAQYVVKDLQTRGMIQKNARFKKLVDGTHKQTSNQYTITKESEEKNCKSIDAHDALLDEHHAQLNTSSTSFCAQDAPYNSGFMHLDSLDLYTSTELKEEDDHITRIRNSEIQNYACYADIYQQMIRDQGTGVLCYKQTEFLDNCKLYNLPACLVKELYPNVRKAIQEYHFHAIARTFEKFTFYLVKKRIDNPIAWFITTFRNEDLKVRSELQIKIVNNAV